MEMHYMFQLLKKFSLLLFLCLSFPVWAKVETSLLFVRLSDAMAEIKQGSPDTALPHLVQLEHHFQTIPTHKSTAGQVVLSALYSAKNSPNSDTLELLARALLAFEKEQNPIDYTARQEQFAKRIKPIYQKLVHAIEQKQLDEIQNAYKRFNNTWTVNEKIVREISLGHYGQIETAMALLRVAMLAEPANFKEMHQQVQQLGIALDDFNAGNLLQLQTTNTNAPQTLLEGIVLLEDAYSALLAQQHTQAQSAIYLFIQHWPVFEGEVRTRDSHLYTRLENDLPIIMAKSHEIANQAKLAELITNLKLLNLGSRYNAFDAMFILLREGLEALLIIMALLTTLNATKQPNAKHWVYAGAGLGILASIVGALALQQLFPTITAGIHREILEGLVGITAVIAMLFVGAWLHNKSSQQGWKHFIEQQVGNALATGSLFSMLSLSFLAVFREGAETMLFYAGILPQISLQDFLLGIVFALLCLAGIAWLMQRSASKLPLPQLFKLMTWLIYALGFKILGVSIHTLQLTQILPRHIIDELTNLPSIGLYSSWEGLSAQLLYILLILCSLKYVKE
ncbi:FTR1 family iron permease [Bibersteinia trehalosi]|uniref:FTR1 family iron permease n=3 Tax=Bibersteinia trehalosi TaxID=47735 RepID=A0A3R8LCR1_BIBTR|nr:FTR1 family protein [Bibersteinia trehalosi]RRN04893.1 FTR1 family iron permease [Bibersteinia trehalosi]